MEQWKELKIGLCGEEPLHSFFSVFMLKKQFLLFPVVEKSYYLKKQSWFLQVYLMQQFLIYSWVQGRPSYDLKNNWVILLFYPYCYISTPTSPKFSYFWTFYILLVGLGEVIHYVFLLKKRIGQFPSEKRENTKRLVQEMKQHFMKNKWRKKQSLCYYINLNTPIY